MQRSFLKGLAAAALVATLTACGLTFDGFDPVVPDGTVTSNTNPTAPVTQVQLAAGQTIWIQVNVPSAQRGVARRLVIEADDDGGATSLSLVLFDADGVVPLASTSGTAYFRRGLAGLDAGFVGTALAERVGRAGREAEVVRSIDIALECVGPCISRRADVSSVMVRLRNDGPFSDTVPFYAYTETWRDPGEIQNDSVLGRRDVSRATAYRGAIERLGDIDFVRFTQSGMVNFDQRPGYNLNLQLDLYTAGGAFLGRYSPGAPAFPVFANEYAMIRSNPSAERASVYGFYDVYYSD
jgi:hypothetical protein